MKALFLILTLAFNTLVSAHEFTPTYIKFEPSFQAGAYVTKMKLFNKRSDVEYYEIEVLDGSWNKIPFAISQRVFQVKYLETKNIEIFVRQQDAKNVVYVCSKSKIQREDKTSPLVSSRICSKVK